MTLADLKSREAIWRQAYDALIVETDTTEDDVTEIQSARFDELHEEAEAIEEAYGKLGSPEAKVAATGFAFLFRNVSEMGRGPKQVIALCEAVIA